MPKHWCFELWCWKRLLRVPWPARRSNQSILKEISPEYSLEGLMLKLKFQYIGLMQRTDSLEKKPWCWERWKAGGEGDNRGWDGWMASLTRWTWVWASTGSWWWTRKPGMLQAMGLQRVGEDWATELKVVFFIFSYIRKLHISFNKTNFNSLFTLYCMSFKGLFKLCFKN